MYAAVSVIASLYPSAGASIYKRVKKFWFTRDDLNNFTVYDFGEMAQNILLKKLN
jgi:hypothetical protein